MTMTQGQKQVWAARYERVQHECMAGLMMEWYRERGTKLEKPGDIPREQMMAMFAESIRQGVDQANGAVLSLSVLPPPEGQAGAQLREMLGIAEPLRLAAPEGFPEPMDYSLPPPGWMFPEGRTDVVHAVPADQCATLCKPRFADGAAFYDGERLELVELAQGWRVHMETNDPPGYEVRGRQEDEFEHQWKVRLMGQMVAQGTDQSDMRAFAWRCFERPRHVVFMLKLGRHIDCNLSEVIGWSDAQLEGAMAYIQAMSSWEAARPSAPPHLC